MTSPIPLPVRMPWWRGDRIVTVADNHNHLGYRADDITRDARYTRYADDRGCSAATPAR
ncbi:hypothetical protein [Streptomyces flavidovirens]